MLTIILGTVLAIITALLCFVQRQKQRNGLLPPGPRGLPFVGNLLQLGTKSHLKLCQWALEYGKMYTIRFGGRSVLVINDVKRMKELLGMSQSTGSFITEMVTMIPKGRYGLHADRQARLEQRRFFVRVLREFGLRHAAFRESLILREVRRFIDWIKKENLTRPSLQVNRKLMETTGNVSWEMIFGEQQPNEVNQGSKLVDLLQDFSIQIQTVTKSGLLFFPWIKYLDPVGSGYNAYKTACENIYNQVENSIKERKENPKASSDFIVDAYIEKVRYCDNTQSSFYGELGNKHSTAALVSLFLGGGESPGNMVNWIIFYLSVFPQVQEKLQQEIDNVIDREREPRLADKPNMPYTDAVIMEALRFATLVPFGVMHAMIENVKFRGYDLPEGLLLLPNLYHVHFDTAIWGDPENFRPSRFLEKGRNLKEFMVAFQPGKRTCPGQLTAMDTIFLFVTMLFQSYTFEPDNLTSANIAEYLEPETGFGLHPRKLPVVAISRF